MALQRNYVNFAKEYADSFALLTACKNNKVAIVKCAARLTDPLDELTVYVKNIIDYNALTAGFVTPEVIDNALLKIMVSGDESNKVKAAKLLMERTSNEKIGEKFLDLLSALQTGE